MTATGTPRSPRDVLAAIVRAEDEASTDAMVDWRDLSPGDMAAAVLFGLRAKGYELVDRDRLETALRVTRPGYGDIVYPLWADAILAALRQQPKADQGGPE